MANDEELPNPSSSTTTSLSESANLTIIPPHAKYVFSGEAFSLHWSVEGRSLKESLVQLEATLVSEPGTVTQLETSEPALSQSKQVAVLQCSIRMGEIPVDGAAFKICLMLPADDVNGDQTSVISVESDEIHLVNAKVKIEHVEWESPFYKDMGGRDKGQLVRVGAFDRDDRLLPQAVEFVPTLCYEHYDVPVDQKELTILPYNDEPSHHVEASRIRNFKFRYSNISKNHQGRNLVVRFHVRGRGDIGPADTLAVEVKSKIGRRNGRKKGSGRNRSISTSSRMEPCPRPPIPEVRDVIEAAIRGIESWAGPMFLGFGTHMWTVQGYFPNPDGTPNLSRPFYAMPNPNDLFEDTFNEYNTVVFRHLENLRKLANDNSPPSRPPMEPPSSPFQLPTQPLLQQPPPPPPPPPQPVHHHYDPEPSNFMPDTMMPHEYERASYQNIPTTEGGGDPLFPSDFYYHGSEL